MPTKTARAMIEVFKEAGKLGVQPGGGHKLAIPVSVDAIKTAIVEQS